MKEHTWTALFADVVHSELASAELNRISHVLKIVDLIPSSKYPNTWGDALFTVFESTAEAVKYALTVHERLRFYDWRQYGVERPPQLRIGIDVGRIEEKTDDIKGPIVDGEPIVRAARIEPIAEAGAVYVSDRVAAVAGDHEFFFDDLGWRDLKHGGKAHVFRAHWAHEKRAVQQQRCGPLLDEQYYRRADAFRRFAFLWLLLDQLPVGSWGRSVPIWMREVWRDVPDITLHPIKEDEGGFETTILNLEMLTSILGPDMPLNRIGNAAGNAGIKYLLSRHGPDGFGTLGFSRQGYVIDAHARHTALVGWFLGHVIKKQALESPELRNLFFLSAQTLFGGPPDQVAKRFEDDRNPLLLYLAAWHTARALETPEWSAQAHNARSLKQMLATWRTATEKLRPLALASAYSNKVKGSPETLLKHRGPHLDPLVIPYGGFIRMEAYTLLSTAALVDEHLDEDVRHRIADGVRFIVDRYLEQWPPEVRYKRHERLQPKASAPFPYYPNAGFDQVPVQPDLGTAGMLLRVLRSREIRHALWGDREPESFGAARYYLSEDLTQLFDRYLAEPGLFALTHPGMLVGALIDDHPRLRARTIEKFRSLLSQPPPVVMSAEHLGDVLSERRIDSLIENAVADDGAGPKIQMATHSLTRLLLDRLRPGRYLTESLGEAGVRRVADDTLQVYRSPAFVERYEATWGHHRDEVILAPFLRLLKPGSHVLDLGSGPGHYAIGLIQAGHRVSLLDASRAFLNAARKRLEQENAHAEEAIEGDVLDPAFRHSWQKKYDAVWCSALFAHVPRSEWPHVLEWIRHLLQPDAPFFANVIVGNPRVFALDGRYFQYVHRSADFDFALRNSGFEVNTILKRRVRRNTYREPFVQTEWANYYAECAAPLDAEHSGEMESVLTSLAYSRSVGDFARAHHAAGPTPDRTATIESRLNKLAGLLGETHEPKVLDAGCGLGDYVVSMATRGWLAAGIDISEKSLERARQTCPVEARDRTRFFFGDMRKLSDDWSSLFDAVLCITAMQHIPLEEASHVLAEFGRVLRGGGILRIDVQVGRGTGFDPDLRFVQGYENADIVTRLLADAGFDLIEKVPWTLPPGQNSFRRPLALDFVELWARKR